MNDTIKSIVDLLIEGKPELQVAAAQVLGELRPKDAAAIDALSNGLDRSPLLGRFCLDALAKIANPAALAKMAEAVVEHEVLSDHAAHLLGDLGPEAHGVLAEIYPQAIGEQRGRILSVLGRELSDASIPVVVGALLTNDLMDVAATMLERGSRAMTPAMKKLLRESLQERLDDSLVPNASSNTVAPNTVARVLAVLAVVDAKGSKTLFLKCIEVGLPTPVRSAAFRALRGAELTANQTRR
jgi:HEAT repeat protein